MLTIGKIIELGKVKQHVEQSLALERKSDVDRSCGLTTELSDSRRQERWSAQGTHELPPGVERSSGAAVRSSDFVRRSKIHLSIIRGERSDLSRLAARTLGTHGSGCARKFGNPSRTPGGPKAQVKKGKRDTPTKSAA
jgi:hypothetical protein